MSDVESYVDRVRDWMGPVAFRVELVKYLRDQDKRIAELEQVGQVTKGKNKEAIEIMEGQAKRIDVVKAENTKLLLEIQDLHERLRSSHAVSPSTIQAFRK